MEQKFGKNSILGQAKRPSRADIEALRKFCEREGKMVEYRKGEQLEREGDPARWFGFVTEGCFKYVTHGISMIRKDIIFPINRKLRGLLNVFSVPYNTYTSKLFSSSRNSYILIYTMPSLSW